MKKIISTVMLIFSVTGFITATGLIYNHINYRQNIVLETKTQLQHLTKVASQGIEAILMNTMDDANKIANDLTRGKIEKSIMLKRLKKVVQNNPNYYGGTITYRPFGFDPDYRLYSAYYKKSGIDGKLEFVQVETVYDYTKPGYSWYVEPMKNGSCWGEPYWGPASKTYMVTYSSVFYEKDSTTGKKIPLGVITIDISMDQIKNLIENINLGPSGFGALTSAKGAYLYHPNTEYVVSQKNIIQVAREKNDEDRLTMAKMAAKGQGGILNHISTTTHQSSWLVFAPISLTNWSLQNTFLKKDIKIDVDTLRRQIIWIIFFVLVCLLALLACVCCRTNADSGKIWLITTLSAVLIGLGIGSIWIIALTYNPADKISGIKISDKMTLKNIMKDHIDRSEKKHLEPPIYVPTGIFIDFIKFSGPNDVHLSGYIWQRYSEDFPEKVKKEFMISKASNVSIKEVNRTIQNGEEIIRSYFEAKIRQKLTHVTYPLEQERIGLRIIHKELGHNIVLTPDLEAYTVRSASLLPGLDSGAFISGWKLMNAYYELRQRDLNTDFGVVHTIKKGNYPVLYYNIGIQRNFIDAFISNLTPLIIVSIMLFLLLLLMNKIDTAKVFSICVAMFFVIVFSHIDIRSKISAQQIFYLEYFFFLTYGSILYVSLNAIGATFKTNIPLLSCDSKSSQLLFWPVLLGVIFFVTMVTFY